MSFIMELDSDTFIGLIQKAIEKDIEDRLWQKWLAELPNMDGKTFIPFDRYKEKHFKHEETQKMSDEEILQDAESILKSMSR